MSINLWKLCQDSARMHHLKNLLKKISGGILPDPPRIARLWRKSFGHHWLTTPTAHFIKISPQVSHSKSKRKFHDFSMIPGYFSRKKIALSSMWPRPILKMRFHIRGFWPYARQRIIINLREKYKLSFKSRLTLG